jgi:hypothetical protein
LSSTVSPRNSSSTSMVLGCSVTTLLSSCTQRNVHGQAGVCLHKAWHGLYVSTAHPYAVRPPARAQGAWRHAVRGVERWDAAAILCAAARHCAQPAWLPVGVTHSCRACRDPAPRPQ